MQFLKGGFLFFATAIIFLANPLVAFATTLAEQTDDFSSQLNVWQTIQELGSNLSGKAGTFVFRVSTSRTNLNQFDYTALNSRIYDKTQNTYILGCVPAGSDPNDRLRGLTFTTAGVPAGYEDVSIDFSCRDYDFIPGRRYLIFITNANMGNSGSGVMLFATAAYGTNPNLDYFTGGGARYGNGNSFDYANNSGSCNPVNYIWNSQTNNSGCIIFSSPRDDLYFILNNTSPPSKTPLILVPGIGGSELKVAEGTEWFADNGHGGIYSNTYTKDEKVWVNEAEAIKPGDDDYFDILRMKPDGINSEANIGLTDRLLPRAYQNTIDFFMSNGYTLNKDFFMFPYDWRKDISLTASSLDQKIEQIKQQTNNQKVDIVSHSMGGLVARNYIADPSRAQKIRKLVTLGTPHLGSTKTIKQLHYGECLNPLPVSTDPFCLGITDSEVKDIIQNMISGYELSPTQAYFTFYTGEANLPLPFRDDRDMDNNGVTGPLNYNQTKTLLTNLGYNTALFIPSETFHSIDSDLANTNGVEVTIIAGSGIATLGQIIEKYFIDFAGIQIPYKDVVKINGDETVPLFSASLSDPTRNISLAGNAKIYYTKQKHGKLVSDGPALKLAKNILSDDNQIPEGVSTQPYQLEGTQLSVHSPVLIHVYDSNGNHTGPTNDGNFEASIPGSSYDTLDDTKFVWLTDSGQYTIKFEATNQGSFDFKIREFKNDINTQTILYKKIPLTATTLAETIFDTTSLTPPILQVDSDGNGEVDSQVNPTVILTGNSASDQTPPKTAVSLTGTKRDNGWFKDNVTVELLGQDEASRSGVAKTEFWLAGTQKIHTYTKPITLSREGINKLKVKSTDLAGNEELPQEIEIKIDKTAPELKITPDFPNRRLKITGKDNLSTTQIQATASGEVTITDQTGNITRLQIEQNEEKNQISLKNVSYKDSLSSPFPENQFRVIFSGTHQQTINIAGTTEVTANYNRQENKTYIEIKKPDGTIISETRNGFILLQLLTNKGQLEVKY
ncbi:MAG: alpha/beta hydrolase [bacterium]|nr:alpha/beta hydrolase [bacterium]